jgi:hypothetical protein
MADEEQSPPDRKEEPPSGPPRGALVALLLVVALIGAFMFVMHRLTEAGKLQDCIASGRLNCAPIATQHQ